MFIVSKAWVGSDGILCSNSDIFEDKESAINCVKDTILNLLDINYSDWEDEDFDAYTCDCDGKKYAWRIIEFKIKLVK